ncbi:MAG: Gfo/Idh/MocA family oxidoreductase [Coriobacteriales bacterium]|jgi:virulence factor
MEKKKTLRVGVVGCGNMGRNHVRVLSTMQEFELVGCYDTDAEVARKIAGQYEVKAFDTMEHLFSEVDVVHIVVPSFLHKELAVQAAQAGCHVLVEKPIALTLSDAQVIIDACKKAGVRLCVGHVERFNPAITTLKKVLEPEHVIAAEFHRLSPFFGRVSDTSVVQDLMIHDIDIMNAFASSPIKRIVAQGRKLRTDKLDYCQALVTFEDGTNVGLTASRVTEAKIRNARVTCSHAYVSVDYVSRSLAISRKTNFTLDVGYEAEYRQENIVEKVVVPNIEPLRAEFSHFAHCINTGEAVATSGEMGKKALEICEEIEKACEF